MTERMRFILDGDDRLTPVLNHAGDSSARLHRRLGDDMDGNSRAVQGFTRDADGRLRDLRGRFLSVADAQRAMAGGLPDLTRRLGDVSDAGGDASIALGKSGGGLGGSMQGVAAIAGLSLLPAIGALVPMMAGAALGAGTLKLGFAGVGGALEAQTKGTKEYKAALKDLPPEARNFTKALVDIKGEFSGVGKNIQKAMLPGFTKAVKEAKPVVDILGDSMTELGGDFGDAAEGVGRLLKDSGFQDDLQTNLQLGSRFVREMTSSLGPFTESLLDFGAASGPTLDAFSDGLSGLLGEDLPGLFEGLETGIPGASDMLNGLFSAVGDLLPALGDLSGEVAATFGPVFGDSLELGGKSGAGALEMLAGAARVARPVLRDVGYGIKTVLEVGELIGPTLADTGTAIAGAFLPVASAVDGATGPLQTLNHLVNDNKGTILEGSRVFGGAMIDMTGAAIAMAPAVLHAFTIVSTGIVSTISGIAHGAATAFGWIPGLGGKLRAADKSFGNFRDNWIGGLTTAERKANAFAAAAGPKLSSGKLKLDINNWSSQLADAKAKLKTVPASKQSALKANIRDLEAKIASARRQLSAVDGKTAYTYIRTTKTTVEQRYVESHASPNLFKRNGGPAPGFAAGGMPGGLLQGAGTGTSDSIPMWWASHGEYVVNARATAKHRGLLEAINSGQLGSGTDGAGLDVGKGLIKGMADSHSGVESGARLMAGAVLSGIRGELQIASPSKRTKALAADAGKGLLVGLTGSQAKIKSTSKDLAKDIWNAFSGSKDNKLVAYVNRQTSKLLTAAKKRDALVSKIATAKKYASDVTSAARENAGLANLGMDADQVSAGGIKAGLAGKLAQVKQFTKYIDMLSKKGLNKGLLRQILNMGPEAGYAYASALVGADKNTFKSINSLQSSLDKQTTSLGQVGADRLYDAGKNAGKGFLKGLEGQQKDIEKLMMSIAKGMQKAIKKSLGIKSPSTVMAELGSYSTQGLARGLVDAVPHLDRALDVVSGRVAGTQPVMGRPAVAGAGGGNVINVHIQIDAAMDPVAVGQEFQRILIQFGRAQGTTVNLSPGR
ncbi:hypothetical protein [Streptomyces sp. NPDC059759]|uniref:hypothetical protein n=1 Tax=Streptomyces sp. NPDC059759 TaxID=3346936 RepID=UPI003647B145